MDLARLEQRLNEIADIVSADPRLIRRVIKLHRTGVGAVPHSRCYAIRKTDLSRVLDAHELELNRESTNDWVIFVARPSLRELRLSQPDLFARTIRAAFHARIHMDLEHKASIGVLNDSVVRKRLEQIGRTEFEEIRQNLERDDLLLKPRDDREVYIEFAALYLELREFAPELIATTFPGLSQRRANEVLAADVDLEQLFGRAGLSALRSSRASLSSQADFWETKATPTEDKLSTEESEVLLAAAERARERREHAKSCLLAARAERSVAAGQQQKAEAALHLVALELCRRLAAAVRSQTSDVDPPIEWVQALVLLARRASELPKRSVAAKVLFALEQATATYEQPGFIVDLPSFLLSFGRRSFVRPWSEICTLPIARSFKALIEQVDLLELPAASRASVGRVIQQVARLSEVTARNLVRPRITRAFESIGLSASSPGERKAYTKLVEELLDQALDSGFLSLPQLRDAVSRNDVKLPDLNGVRELWFGDPLLLADAALSIELDGVYRRGDVYLRALQKLSSIAFGTRLGRVLSLYFLLPVLGAFVILEGIRHIIGPLLVWLGFPSIAPFTFETFALTTAALFALIHSEDFRATARQLLELVGVVLAWVFFRIPRAILGLPFVERWLARPVVRSTIRQVLLPAIIGVVVYLVLGFEQAYFKLALAFLVFVVASTLMSSRLGSWLEDFAVVQLVPTWHVLSRQWLPDLVRLIGSVFRTIMDGFERALYFIDNAVRFRRSRSKLLLSLAAATGLFWAIAAFVIRIYVTLLVEPELNPIKHFPVVTVAHKLMLPFLGPLMDIVERPFALLGPVIGGALAALTVFLLPSIFGFLAWELKENYRLYRATRPCYLPAVRVGPHGETIRDLLVVGVHSGTLPKLFERLRRAAHQHEQRAAIAARSGTLSVTIDRNMNRLRDTLRRIEDALVHFVERELSAPLELSQRWSFGPVGVAQIDISSNRIRIQLTIALDSALRTELRFEQLGGRIVAGIFERGFLQKLNAEELVLFENALAGFYHRAHVELVRQQLEGELGMKYKITDKWLLVRPDPGTDTEINYRLDVYRPRKLKPRVRGALSPLKANVLDSRRILYTQQRVSWKDWEQALAVANDPNQELTRLLQGPSLLGLTENQARSAQEF